MQTTNWRDRKSNRILESSRDASRLRRKYLQSMWEAIDEGEHFVYGYAPMELLNSMGLYLIPQSQYSSLLAARGLDLHYRAILAEHGYLPGLINYHTLGVGYALAKDAPLGQGSALPRPSAVVGQVVPDIAPLELFAREFECPLFVIEDPDHQQSIPERWWEERGWIEPYIVDHCVGELAALCRFLECLTGKVYSETRLREYLDRADQTAEYYWKAVDLVYTSPEPAAITYTDCIAEVAVWETHFGEPWTLDHAKGFYEEVEQRVFRGVAAVPNERLRILWGSTPIWFNLGFFNQWEESHGAVFMEMNYLPRSERTIQRDHSDPLRAALLRRHMNYSGASPVAAANLHINQAIKYHADGVVIPRRGWTKHAAGVYNFVGRALEQAGIPTLTLDYSPIDSSAWDERSMTRQVTEFIESLTPKRRRSS